ncbi:two component Fis family sigma54 specific transcriptional regulator [Geothermobacter ehrlichii]|uniref:DNA-binding transcriptional regulator NtrC n=1 Tax=Geothermobacter ehrlichii TaxID=213224 RepID=A0A5D3WM83_9BACT|nr:nitrogen regulation protein NR(I) [Geothermobacter ehrlichii]TYO98656.1 two component Fis family sigma54 specific transcriptional regulator [Geothermobacter ehrlichii]
MAIRRILIADDEDSIRWVLERSLSRQGYEVATASDGRQALELFRHHQFDMAILDIRMPGIDGLELLERFLAERPDLLVIIMTAETSMKNAIEAMKKGAYDYLPKPFDLDEVDALILKASKANQVREQVCLLKEELREHYQLDRNIIGNSPPMQKLFKILGRVAPSDATVLITGESGTGKELVARAIHFNSPRLGKPFIAINCAAIPRELLESELFGHEKGAFTGASERKAGKFEQAHGGTLFLDEIGDMPLELQAKLLRVLQEKEITRTGGSRTIAVDVRIIAATNQNLQEKVREKSFREDLFYRLNVVPVALPPLRERREDIPLLVDFFLEKAREELQVDTRSCSKEAIGLLQRHDWPGNVRELENAIMRAALLSPDPVLSPADFPDLQGGAERREESLEDLIGSKLRQSLDPVNIFELDNLYELVLHQMERPLLRIVLEKTRGNQVKAAEILGINRNTLRKKLQVLGLKAGRGS